MLYTWTGDEPYRLGPFSIAPGEVVDVEYPPTDPGFVEGEQHSAPAAGEKPATADTAPAESAPSAPPAPPVSSPAAAPVSAPTAPVAPPVTSTVVSA